MKKSLVLNVTMNDCIIDSITNYESEILFYVHFFKELANEINATIVFGNTHLKLSHSGIFLFDSRLKTYTTINPQDFKSIEHKRSIYLGANSLQKAVMPIYSQGLVVVSNSEAHKFGGVLIINKEIARQYTREWWDQEIVDDSEISFVQFERPPINSEPYTIPLYITVAKYINKAIEINLRDMNKDLYCDIDEKQFQFSFPGLKNSQALALLSTKPVAFEWVHNLIKNVSDCLLQYPYQMELFIVGSATAAINYSSMKDRAEFDEWVQKVFDKFKEWIGTVAFNLYDSVSGLLVADVTFTIEFDFAEGKKPEQLPTYRWRSFGQPLETIDEMMQKLALVVRGKAS
ncbi:MAG: hypothetical protein MUC87_20390 [Bacteroidia bacterium]|jgi:hypothetical protein|nr:hypothetical protein [Bacteroidia bacterium]